MPIDPAAAYLDGKQSVAALVRAATPAQLETTVPACPLWNVGDVVRHLCGVAIDLCDGRMPLDGDGVEIFQSEQGTARVTAFTDNHVTTRRGRPIEETLREWDAATDNLLPVLRGERQAPQSDIPFIALVPVTDIAAHLHDIRGALGQPGERDSALTALGFASYFASFAMRAARRGLPPLRVRYDGKERATGEGDVAATWSGDRFELFRALAGRRSNAQIAAMSWDGDPAPYLPIISMYGPRADALVE
jgi:uncharacterized protein (TIGR03083 family)